MKLLSSLAAVGLLGFLIAVLTAQHGCTSNCGTYCPATTVYIGSSDDYELSVDFTVNGPACPPFDSVTCTGDESQTFCTHTTITGQSVGWCDVLVAFDPYLDGRPWQIIHLEFGPTDHAPGTCCAGYPVIGPSVYVIPDHPAQGGVFGTTDGGTMFYDAISTIHDASAADATDGGADAGTDAASKG